MSADRLAELQRLLAKATPDPWGVANDGDINAGGGYYVVADHEGLLPAVRDPADAVLIAALRNAAPALLAVAVAARAFARAKPRDMFAAADDLHDAIRVLDALDAETTTS